MLSRRTLTRLTLAGPLAATTWARPFPAIGQEDDALWPTADWEVAAPEEFGLDAGLLAQAGDQLPFELPHHSALLVVRSGRLVFERYYGDQDADRPLNVRSVTKSMISALIGIALDEGLIVDLDQPLGELIPDRIPTNADPVTPTITVRHLLTMTAGWAWDIGADYFTVINSPDWAEMTLSLPVIYEPGTFYAYNTGGSHLLSVILQEVSGEKAVDFAEDRLLRYVGIERRPWVESPQGESSGGFGLFLTPREMAKLGYLFLREGRWDDRQLVPADYARAATSLQSAGDATGLAAYGFQWWVTNVYGLPAYFALGYGSQYVYVVPDLDLIVVAAVNHRLESEELRPARPFIENLVVAAALSS
jgi:CubicO group peptidase (beta-lactamase class C family)